MQRGGTVLEDRRGPSALPRGWPVLVPTFLVLNAGAFLLAWYALFSTFQRYDDEGYGSPPPSSGRLFFGNAGGKPEGSGGLEAWNQRHGSFTECEQAGVRARAQTDPL